MLLNLKCTMCTLCSNAVWLCFRVSLVHSMFKTKVTMFYLNYILNEWTNDAETISNSICVVFVSNMSIFLHEGDSKYTGSCEKNHSIYISDLNHHDLNRPTLLLMHSPCFTVAIAWYLLKIMLKWKNCENLGRSVKLRKIVSLLSKKSQKLKTKSRILETSDTIRS